MNFNINTFLAILALVWSLAVRMVPKYTISRKNKKKKVVSKKTNNYMHRCLQARIHTLQVVGENFNSYDYPDN